MPKMEKDENPVYIHPKAAWEKLRAAGEKRQNVYLYGATGYGKTELMRRYLRRRKHIWLDGGELTAQQLRELERPRGVIVVIDDLALVTDPEVQEEVQKLACDPHVWLVMAGRCPLPRWLQELYVSCRLMVIPEADLALTQASLGELYLAWGIQLPQKMLDEVIYPLAEGNPLASRLLAMEMSNGTPYTPELLDKLIDGFWAYLNRAVYSEWDVRIQQLMMQLSVMGSFTLRQAEQLTGMEDAGQLLGQAQETGNLFTVNGGVYTMRPSLKNSMRWRLRNTCSREVRDGLCTRAGALYEQAGDIPRALELYELCGDEEKIHELLVNNVRRDPAAGYYYELGRYYLALPEEEVRSSPDLMTALSMVHAVRFDAEESERWYQTLVQYMENAEGEERKRALGEKIYLDLCLPHRGSTGMEEKLKTAAETAKAEGLTLGRISITGGMPSLMNGGKDFCEWSKEDDQLAQRLAGPVEELLGSHSKGLLELALAESRFEKGDSQYQVLEMANRGMMATMAGGEFEMQFAGAAIIARLYLIGGHIDDAMKMLQETETRAIQRSENRVLRNVRAMQCRVMLWQGRLNDAEQWMEREPSDDIYFNMMDRYCYLTRARVYMAQERYDRAATLLTRLEHYADLNERTWLQMECGLLAAIVRYRTGDPAWKPKLLGVLHRAEKYHFVRLFSREGAALMEPLRELNGAPEIGNDFFAQVLSETNAMAAAYPGYLRQSASAEPLKLSERGLEVLRMQSMGLSRSVIAQQLGLSERTVKYQCEQAYRKLGVNNKVEAIEAARKLNLL